MLPPFGSLLLTVHVLAAVSFGGVLLGCLVQTVFMLAAPATARGHADPVVPAALLGFGLPAAVLAAIAGAMLAGSTGLTAAAWVETAAAVLVLAALLGGIAGLVALARMVGRQERFGLLMAQAWLLGLGLLCWAAGLAAMILKDG